MIDYEVYGNAYHANIVVKGVLHGTNLIITIALANGQNPAKVQFINTGKKVRRDPVMGRMKLLLLTGTGPEGWYDSLNLTIPNELTKGHNNKCLWCGKKVGRKIYHDAQNNTLIARWTHSQWWCNGRHCYNYACVCAQEGISIKHE